MAIDTQKERRNFPGYEKNQFFALQDMVTGDTRGSTETDSETDSPAGGYTKINSKGKKASRSMGGRQLPTPPLGSGTLNA